LYSSWLWTQKTQATVERDPFRYVPYPGSFATEYPVHHTFLSTLKNVFKEIDVDTSQIDDLMFYLGEYYSLRPNKADIQAAPDMASEFMSRHPFSEEDEIKPKRIKISSRLKLGFEVNRLRLLWIQQLTGMFMDALVFGALYVTLLFPDVVVNDIVPLQYLLVGLLVLALPLFTLVTFIGWYYDKRMRVWSADAVVKAERNPYQYLPQPRSYTIELPFYFSFFETVREVFRELNIDTTDVDRIVQYLEDYGSLTIKKDADIARARGLRKSHGAVFESKEQEIE
jgi:hypothetical protein